MKERSLRCKDWEVRAILEGRKTQTRRVDNTSIAFYRLLGDKIECIHRSDEDIDRCYSEADSRIPQLGLCRGQRWPDLFENQICRIWAEGARGLVSAERSFQREGLPIRFAVSREPQSNQVGSQACLHGVSRIAAIGNAPSSSFGRQQVQQHAVEFSLGHTRGELGRSGSSRSRNGGRETSCSQVDRRRKIIACLGNLKGSVQPKESSQMPWDVPVGNLADHKWQVGRQLWVREAFSAFVTGIDDMTINYTATPHVFNSLGPSSGDVPDSDLVTYFRMVDRSAKHRKAIKYSSIHMPRWASRITLEITGVRVERLQDISPNDCRAEGMPEKNNDIGVRYAFGQLWESIHRRPQLPPNPRSRRYGRVKRWLDKHPDQSWEANPWVWVIEFRRLEGLR